jgi:hypothetical protein
MGLRPTPENESGEVIPTERSRATCLSFSIHDRLGGGNRSPRCMSTSPLANPALPPGTAALAFLLAFVSVTEP